MKLDINNPLHQRQIALEAEMVSLGGDRFISAYNDAAAKGRGSATQPGVYLVKQAVNPVAAGIKEFVAEAFSGKPGVRAKSALVLKDMDPYIAAYVSIRAILAGVLGTKTGTLTALAKRVGRNLEDEARFTAFANSKPALFETIIKGLGSNEQHSRTVLTYAMTRFDIPWDGWSPTERINVGIKMIDLCIAHSGLIELLNATQSSKVVDGMHADTYVIRLSDKTREWLDVTLDNGMNMFPRYLPTLLPPKDWEGVQGGGYFTKVVRPHPLIIGAGQRRAHDLQRKLLTTSTYMGAVYSGLNAIQSTGWQINRAILDVMQTLYNTSDGVAELPSANPVPLPDRPPTIDTDPEVLQKWKWAARDAYKQELARRRQRLNVKTMLDIAHKFEEEPQFYFPHALDSRGRAYPIPSILTPQGSDTAKALLRFADGKPLGIDGERWLAIHGANVFGVDKVSFDARVEWVRENEDKIMHCANDPYENLWWTEADKPWSFLAFCFEWCSMVVSVDLFITDRSEFVSKLPIALDGSCNGLQHFSAMLLDPVGGAAVNLVPSDTPQDIYQRVADRAIHILRQVANGNTSLLTPIAVDKEGKASVTEADRERWADGWVQFGINRKITKRPVMVLPYGGTPRSCLNYVIEAVTERINGGQAHNFGAELPKATAMLSSVIWASIGDVVIAAREAMAWLQKTARVISKTGRPLQWTTPSGFVAVQYYTDDRQRRIKAKIAGMIIRPAVYEETDKLDKSKQASAISPNFIHSLDASAMMQTVDMMHGHGVTSFAMIHDSYGTHACNTTFLASTLRNVFVDTYLSDPLNHLREELIQNYPEVADDIPELPEKGTLDLEQILLSQYFFA